MKGDYSPQNMENVTKNILPCAVASPSAHLQCHLDHVEPDGEYVGAAGGRVLQLGQTGELGTVSGRDIGTVPLQVGRTRRAQLRVRVHVHIHVLHDPGHALGARVAHGGVLGQLHAEALSDGVRPLTGTQPGDVVAAVPQQQRVLADVARRLAQHEVQLLAAVGGHLAAPVRAGQAGGDAALGG